MKFQELIKRIIEIGKIDPQAENYLKVVIPAATFNGGIGGSSCVEVVNVGTGFDFDKDKLFISSKEKLYVEDEETKVAKIFFHKCLASFVNAKRENDQKYLSRLFKSHFMDCIKTLDIEQNIDKVLAETKRLHEEAARRRKVIHATRDRNQDAE